MRLFFPKLKVLGLVLAFLIWGAGWSCSSQVPWQQKSIVVEAPFNLVELLNQEEPDWILREIEFQILDAQDQPVPFGLLRLRWPDAGRLSLQSDEEGILVMQFEEDMTAAEVEVGADWIPNNTPFTEKPYHQVASPIPDASLRLSW